MLYSVCAGLIRSAEGPVSAPGRLQMDDGPACAAHHRQAGSGDHAFNYFKLLVGRSDHTPVGNDHLKCLHAWGAVLLTMLRLSPRMLSAGYYIITGEHSYIHTYIHTYIQ